MLFVVAVPIYVLTLVRCLRLRVTLWRRWRPLHHRWRTHHLYLFGHRWKAYAVVAVHVPLTPHLVVSAP